MRCPSFFRMPIICSVGLNSERTRRQLNRLLEEEYPMEIQMSVVYGYEDLAADATVDSTDFRKRYPLAVTRSFFSQEQQQEIGALEIEGEEPLQMLLDKEVKIAPVELSELVQTVQSQDSALVLLELSPTETGLLDDANRFVWTADTKAAGGGGAGGGDWRADIAAPLPTRIGRKTWSSCGSWACR